MDEPAKKCETCKGPLGACVCSSEAAAPEPTEEERRVAALPPHIIGAPGWSLEAEGKAK
jgi:hypothetical protein